MDQHELQHLRGHKEESFRHDPHSPIPADGRETCAGLGYVPRTDDLVFEVPVGPAEGLSLEIPNSDGSSRRYRRGGCLRFHVDGERAYHPYCADNDAFSWPLPLPENWLRVPIRAGETVYAR